MINSPKNIKSKPFSKKPFLVLKEQKENKNNKKIKLDKRGVNI